MKKVLPEAIPMPTIRSHSSTPLSFDILIASRKQENRKEETKPIRIAIAVLKILATMSYIHIYVEGLHTCFIGVQHLKSNSPKLGMALAWITRDASLGMEVVLSRFRNLDELLDDYYNHPS